MSKPTLEGAGVRLRRAFGFGDTPEFGPFLLLDDVPNERAEDDLAGFPLHPHRGNGKFTHVLAGTVERGDGMATSGPIVMNTQEHPPGVRGAGEGHAPRAAEARGRHLSAPPDRSVELMPIHGPSPANRCHRMPTSGGAGTGARRP